MKRIKGILRPKRIDGWISGCPHCEHWGPEYGCRTCRKGHPVRWFKALPYLIENRWQGYKD